MSADIEICALTWWRVEDPALRVARRIWIPKRIVNGWLPGLVGTADDVEAAVHKRRDAGAVVDVRDAAPAIICVRGAAASRRSAVLAVIRRWICAASATQMGDETGGSWAPGDVVPVHIVEKHCVLTGRVVLAPHACDIAREVIAMRRDPRHHCDSGVRSADVRQRRHRLAPRQEPLAAVEPSGMRPEHSRPRDPRGWTAAGARVVVQQQPADGVHLRVSRRLLEWPERAQATRHGRQRRCCLQPPMRMLLLQAPQR